MGSAALLLSRQRFKASRHREAKLALAIAGLSLGLTAAELVLRVSVDTWASHIKVRDGCYHDNPRGYFKSVTYKEDPNTQAFCAGPLSDVWDSCEGTSEQKPAKSSHRIMALGDSFTDGVGVFAKDTWPARLQEQLPQDTQVVNCGKASLFTSHIAKRFLAYRDAHQPETVIYAFVLNDVPLEGAETPDGRDIAFQLPNRQAYAEEFKETSLSGALSEHSALARLISERIAHKKVERDTLGYYRDTYAEANDKAFRESLDLVKAMHELVEERQGRFLVVIWPLLESLADYPFDAIHTKIRAGLETRNIAHLDLLEHFAGRDESALQVHATDHHPNEHAHQEAAEVIAQELVRRGWHTSAKP